MIWPRLRLWAIALVGALAAALGLYAQYQMNLRLREEKRRAEGALKAAKAAKEIRHDVENVSDARLRDALAEYVRRRD